MKRNFLLRNKLETYILLFFVAITLSGANSPNPTFNAENIRIIKKTTENPQGIVAITDSLVPTFVYTHAISLGALPVVQKKQKFFDMMLPSVLIAKTNLDFTRKKVIALSTKKELTISEKAFLQNLEKEYKTHDIQTLIKRLYTFPVSIVLAQAAIESGWGSSRFFLKANNPFGIWSFDPNHNRIEASSNRNGKKIYLRKFGNLTEAINAYYTLLATQQPFAGFRTARMKTQNPLKLTHYLMSYSERGKNYIADLNKIITNNHLEKYDHYQINPDYLR